MQVRILQDTDYTPRPGDSPRCFGQLRCRPGRKLVEIVMPDGSTVVREEVGAMVLYFRAGTTPDLAEDVARYLIANGAAAEIEEPDETRFVTKADILDGIGG